MEVRGWGGGCGREQTERAGITSSSTNIERVVPSQEVRSVCHSPSKRL